MVKRVHKFGRTAARKIIPERKLMDNKTSGGKCLIIAGSKGLFGAAVLAATAASRVGAGYVTLMTDEKKFKVTEHPDFLTLDYRPKNLKKNKFSAFAIGPGLGQSTRSFNLLKALLHLNVKNVVIDADALNLYAKYFSRPLPESWIATPHEGELGRLLKLSVDEIRRNRIHVALLAQKKLGCILLLKGAKTLVINSEQIFELQSGNVALAKAGTGDVLTGMIAGFLAQKSEPFQAACLGGYLHGLIADNWIKENNDYLSFMASDLNSAIAQNLRELRCHKN